MTYSETSSSLPEGMLLLAKKTGDEGSKLKYVKLDIEGLSAYLDAENAIEDLKAFVVPDSEVEDASTNSVARKEYTAKVQHKKADGTVEEEEVQAKYFMLYGFDGSSSLDKKSATGDLLLRDSSGDKKTLKYVALSSFGSLSGDADADGSKQKSVTVDQDSSTIALHGFSSPSTLDITLDEKNDKTKDELKLLVRDGSGGSAELKYASLSVAFPEELEVDTTAGETKSVDKVEVSGEASAYVMLHNFNDSSSSKAIKLTEESPKTEDGLHLLVRESGVLKYATLEADIPPQLDSDKAKSQLSGMFNADSEGGNISSLGAEWNGSTKVFSAWKFSDFSNSVKDRSSLGNADLLVRDQSSKEMKYLSLDAV